jgi:AcrR family transcriptional regulator
MNRENLAMTTAAFGGRSESPSVDGGSANRLRARTTWRRDCVEKSATERERLLTAAVQVLERSGWWGFKVEGVLKQARLSTRSFYRHFEKKDDLLLALLEREVGGAAVALRKRTAAADHPADMVRAYIAATIDFAYREDLAKPSSLFASHWRELLPAYPEAVNACIERFIAPLTEAIQAGIASGDFTSEDSVADARAIFHLVAGVTADQAVLGSVPRDEIERIVLPFVGRAIGLQ